MALFNLFKKKNKPTPKKPASTKATTGKKVITLKTEIIKKSPLKKKESATSRLLKEPHISEKATFLSGNGKYVFKVYKNANKSEIKKAISNLYGVVVKSVNIINIGAKVRIAQGKKGEKSGYKKAIITLEKGHKIEILPH
jgi:large subunit ribosomal protein L23